MAKPKFVKREADRTNQPAEISFKREDGAENQIFILGKGEFYKPGGRKSLTYCGPSVVIVSNGPDMVSENEYDVNSPFVWAYVSRLLHEGHAVGKVTSASDERKAEVWAGHYEEKKAKVL